LIDLLAINVRSIHMIPTTMSHRPFIVVALQLTSAVPEEVQSITGVIWVKLGEHGNHLLDSVLESEILDVKAMADDAHRNKPVRVSDLASTQDNRFVISRAHSDRKHAISKIENAVRPTDYIHPNQPSTKKTRIKFCDLSPLHHAISILPNNKHPPYLLHLGVRQHNLFKRFGDLFDLDDAITNQNEAAELIADWHAEKHLYLTNLSISQKSRFERLGSLSDLDDAIFNQTRAIELMGDIHPNQPGCLSNLGASLCARFECLGNRSDLEDAILSIKKAVDLIDYSDIKKARYLSNLASSQGIHFHSFGDLSYLDNAISNQEKALKLTEGSHPSKPEYFSDLGNHRKARFQHLGYLSDIEDAILNAEKAVELTNDKHPSRPRHLLNLSTSQGTRFHHLGNLLDLENAIANQEKAVELVDDGHSNKPHYLATLGTIQTTRFLRLGHLSDLEDAISNQEKAVDLTSDGHPAKLIYVESLGMSQLTRFKRIGNLSDLDNAIVNIEKAVQLTDGAHPNQSMYLQDLGHCQQTRFKRLGNLSDLENAFSNQEKAIKLTNEENPSRPALLSNLGSSQATRFMRLGHHFDLENAIWNHAKALDLMDDGHPSRPSCLSNLSSAKAIRFERLGLLPDLESAISNIAKAVELTNDDHPDKPWYLLNLGSSQTQHFEFHGDLSYLERAISNQQLAAELINDGHPNKPQILGSLSTSQMRHFQHLGFICDLEDSISNVKKAAKLTSDDSPKKTFYLSQLGAVQKIRFELLGELADREACISSFKAATQLTAAYPRQALTAARQWAKISYSNGDLVSALEACRNALELLPKVAWLGLDTSSRQNWLLEERSEKLSTFAATCAVRLGRLEEAVELLDLGQSILWQQASSLRSDLEILRQEQPKLAEELERVGQQLDAENFSSSAFSFVESTACHSQRGTQDVGKERRNLVIMWESLVERVRQLPQFEYFLKTVPFHQLRRSASALGQVVIINASWCGVDALIFNATGPIRHIPLPDVDLEKLDELSGNISEWPANASAFQRRNHVTHFLKPALRAVWDDILIPIFNNIGISLVNATGPPQRRIWWYPTGPLTLIPIHAAGSGNRTIDVSRLVVSSYVSRLRYVFEAHRAASSNANQKLLIVGLPQTPGQRNLPQTTEEVNRVIQTFRLSGWSEENIISFHGSDATVDHVLGALDSCSWLHFACHGVHDPNFGMKSAFALNDGHLELCTITSKKISNGKFAFLSACQAASGLKNLRGEALHLAAGLQFAGFPSVIATMWNICDDDALKVADHTYRYLFRNGLQQLDPSDAATALNRAVLRFREDPSITVDRWAPFLHLGI
jgi:tetratricopeptide (TPR) repeat protein